MQLQMVDESQGIPDDILIYILTLSSSLSLEKYGITSIGRPWAAIP